MTTWIRIYMSNLLQTTSTDVLRIDICQWSGKGSESKQRTHDWRILLLSGQILRQWACQVKLKLGIKQNMHVGTIHNLQCWLNQCTHTHTPAHTHTLTHTPAHTLTHTHTPQHTHTHQHTSTHTHSHTHTHSCICCIAFWIAMLLAIYVSTISFAAIK